MGVLSAVKAGFMELLLGMIFTQGNSATFFKKHALYMKTDQLIPVSLTSVIG
jgi:hypothetical protein